MVGSLNQHEISGKPKMTHRPKHMATRQTQTRVKKNSLPQEKQAPRKEGHSPPTSTARAPVFRACVLPSQASRLVLFYSLQLGSGQAGQGAH